ncbi:adhesion G protein-coupled receptor E3-like isoform X1 [Alosa sapidissima]|uniref:adhesion G protein-coupled receptor E3-like isoform X1 n=1 Tax=Alosa sapidissima TaxID=34773 RepID=UPI001C09A1BE|nr:adhesion G protein-coupled receptor E3-like isoform X1 [Alosa sapidissima]
MPVCLKAGGMTTSHLFWGVMLLLKVGEVTLSTELDICRSYRNLSDPWRNYAFSSDSFPGYPKSDSSLAAGWYRFTGVGGNVLTQTCSYKSTLSLGGSRKSLCLCEGHSYPRVGEGVKAMSLCNRACSTPHCSLSINVTACTGGFYLYQLFPTDGVFVTDHSSCEASSCGENAMCDSVGCVCRPGFGIPSKFLPTGDSYGCQVVASACPQPCEANARCQYIRDQFKCACEPGFRESGSGSFTCTDADECVESPGICGRDGLALCINTPGGFHCECPSGYIPTPDLDWRTNITVCKELNLYIPREKGKAKGVDHLLGMIENMTSDGLPVKTVTLLLDRLADDDHSRPVLHRNSVLDSMKKLVSQLVTGPLAWRNANFTSNPTEVQILSVEPNDDLKGPSVLRTSGVSMDINLLGVAKNNDGMATVVFMAYSHMVNVLDASFFRTRRNTTKTMMSRVVSATLLGTVNTTLPSPVQFTFEHITASEHRGKPSCVYWNVSAWIEDGCHVSETNPTHTVCSCDHLSTFALIMQTVDTFLSDPILDILNTILVLIGLVFLTLAVMTFALCRWNPRVSNVSRLNLCVCLLLAHPLFLLTQSFLHLIWPHEVLCKLLAGVLHFLFLCCFVWMSIEAVLLFLSVRKLKQVKPSEGVGPHCAALYLIGYGVPLFIVAVSAGVMPEGYGSLQCWLSTKAGFIWSFLGPVAFILTGNIVLFFIILLTLFFTLRGAQSAGSKVKYTRILAIKLLFQFFFLGCPWVLGFFVRSGPAVEVLFVMLNSQQGTFIFLVHCALNNEVRRQYSRWWQKFRPSGDEPGFSGVAMETEQDAPGGRQRPSALTGDR